MVIEQIRKIATSLFFKNPFVILNLSLSFLVNIIFWLLLSILVKASFQPIPLHYNIYFGIDFLGPWYNIFIIPAIGSLIFLINFTLAYFTYLGEKLISYFLVFSTTFFEILLLVSGLLIISL